VPGHTPADRPGASLEVRVVRAARVIHLPAPLRGAKRRGLIERDLLKLQHRGKTMLIALLAVLGVDLIVIVVLLAVVLSRKRWVMRQPGAFRGVIRVTDGEIDGLRPKWVRGYGRWIRDVLVWTKAPLLFRNEILATDGVDEQRPARPDEIKRLGDEPVVIQLAMGDATVEVAASHDDRERLLGPYEQTKGAAVTAQPTPVAD
jgi:hypothetical protein